MSSGLKQIVRSALELKQVSPKILNNLDVLIYRSIVRLQAQDLSPIRTLEFTSKDKKQEKRIDGELIYNFYYLPEDFRKLDEFFVYDSAPYVWEPNEQKLYEKDLTDRQKDRIKKKFHITTTHHDDDSKYEKILIAQPFPEDDEVIKIDYWINGKCVDWDWVDEAYWEAIIADVEKIVGLRSTQDMEAEQRVSDAVSSHKDMKGNNLNNETYGTLNGSFFGKRRPRLPRNPIRVRNKNLDN